MMIRLALFAASAAAVAMPSGAQVLEIGSSGDVRTYDGPTTFTAEGAESLLPEKRTAEGSIDHSQLLVQAAQGQGLDPELLMAVAWHESGGRMTAISNKGALGIMQLMPTTAAELGVDPGDAADNIRGGAIYLRRQIDRFGSVPLALAAYNAGPGAVIRFGGVPPFRETQDYVTRILQRWHPRPLSAAISAAPPIRAVPAVIEVPQL